MITWIQTVLQKHHKIVFGVLLVAIIIAFVFTIGSVPFFGDSYSRGGSVEKKEFCGYNLRDEGTVSYFQTHAYYEIILDGARLQNNRQVEMMMFRQMYLTRLAKDMGLRQVTQKELDEYIRSRPVFQLQDGAFNEAAWEQFKKERLSSGRMRAEDLTAILSQNALVNKMSSLLGGPGYVLLSQIEREYKLINSKFDYAVAELSYKDFKPEIKLDAKAVEDFFNKNMEAYRIGEGAMVETIFLPMKDYASLVKNPTEAELRVFFTTNSQRYATSKDGKFSLPKFEEVKQKVQADFLLESAQNKARQAGEDVALKIYDSGAKINSAELKKVLADMKITTKKVGAIRMTDEKLPEGIPSAVAAQAMRLDADRFYSDPIPTDEGVWIVMISKKLNSYLPTFAQVKAKVEKNYLESQKRKMFFEKGEALAKSLQEGVKAGKKFEDVAKKSGAKTKSQKAFVLSKPEGYGLEIYQTLSGQLPKLSVGAVSSLQTAGDRACVIFVEKIEAPVVSAKTKEIENLNKNAKRSLSDISGSTVVGEKIAEAMKQEQN